MPLVQIDLLDTWNDAQVDVIADAVHEALVAELDVPARDRFHLVERRTPASLRFDRRYLDLERSDRFVLVRITLSAGRATAAKQAFFASLLRLLEDRVGLRPDDLAVVLTENRREDWSFGGGSASYLDLPPERWV